MRTSMFLAACISCALPSVTGCENRVDGVKPVGGDEASPAELERFVRRVHLDLAGLPPEDGFVSETVALLEGGNTAADRAAVIDDLMADATFAEVYVAELDNRAFGGESVDSRYNLLCSVIRSNDPTCMACAPSADPCGDCSCEPLVQFFGERDELARSAADLASGDATTADIERRHAASGAFSALSDPAGTVNALFDVFLGRPPEGEELANGTAMVFGSFDPNMPAGLLFHRHGSNYEDLLDIVFESEIYREAVVQATFDRYLGRAATPVEIAHFSAAIDAGAPDARAVIRAVLSSGEYFEQ